MRLRLFLFSVTSLGKLSMYADCLYVDRRDAEDLGKDGQKGIGES